MASPNTGLDTFAASEEAQRTSEERDLLAVRDALCARIHDKRAGIRGALELLGRSLADALAEAQPSTVLLFLEANERGANSLGGLRALSRDLGLSPFVVATGLRQELPQSLRRDLRPQARRLDALVQALSSVDSQLGQAAQCAPDAARR